MTPSLRYAIFDLDATLYPADSGVWLGIKSRIHQYLIEFMKLTAEEASTLSAGYQKQFGTTLAGLQHDFPDTNPDQFLAFVHDLPHERYLAYDPQLDQMLEDLSLDKSILTNADLDHAERVLSLLGVRRHFDTVVDIRRTNFINKPDPRAFITHLDAIGAHAAECIMIEDSVQNLDTAHSLGMTTLLISPHPHLQPNSAHHHVPDINSAGTAIHNLTLLSRHPTS